MLQRNGELILVIGAALSLFSIVVLALIAFAPNPVHHG